MNKNTNDSNIKEMTFLRKASLLKSFKISNSTLWRWVKSGKFPAPIKMSNRISVWRFDEVMIWLESKDSSRCLKNISR